MPTTVKIVRPDYRQRCAHEVFVPQEFNGLTYFILLSSVSFSVRNNVCTRIKSGCPSLGFFWPAHPSPPPPPTGARGRRRDKGSWSKHQHRCTRPWSWNGERGWSDGDYYWTRCVQCRGGTALLPGKSGLYPHPAGRFYKIQYTNIGRNNRARHGGWR